MPWFTKFVHLLHTKNDPEGIKAFTQLVQSLLQALRVGLAGWPHFIVRPRLKQVKPVCVGDRRSGAQGSLADSEAPCASHCIETLPEVRGHEWTNIPEKLNLLEPEALQQVETTCALALFIHLVNKSFLRNREGKLQAPRTTSMLGSLRRVGVSITSRVRLAGGPRGPSGGRVR